MRNEKVHRADHHLEKAKKKKRLFLSFFELQLSINGVTVPMTSKLGFCNSLIKSARIIDFGYYDDYLFICFACRKLFRCQGSPSSQQLRRPHKLVIKKPKVNFHPSPKLLLKRCEPEFLASKPNKWCWTRCRNTEYLSWTWNGHDNADSCQKISKVWRGPFQYQAVFWAPKFKRRWLMMHEVWKNSLDQKNRS